jgi:hypothetical protein
VPFYYLEFAPNVQNFRLQSQKLTKRIPAQISFLFEIARRVLVREPPAPVSNNPPPVHQRNYRKHFCGGAKFQDREKIS